MCTDEFTKILADSALNAKYKAEQVFTDDGCDEEFSDASDNRPNYWLLPNGDPGGSGFTLDFGCNIVISMFELRNTKNHKNSDR